MKNGVLFDWDGVVIDSGEQHRESWDLLSAELGIQLPADFFIRTFGMRNARIIPEWFPGVSEGDVEKIEALGSRKEFLYRELLRRDGVHVLPGARELISALADEGIPFAIASSTPRVNIDAILEMTGLTGFSAIVTAENVTRGKPDPDVFLTAAAGLGLAPSDCVVIEDAEVGIQAGKVAGCRVIAVTTTNPAEKLGEADVIWPGLAGRTPAEVFSAVGFSSSI